MNSAIIWTAGACTARPGAGGYAATTRHPDGTVKSKSNGRRITTPERMEIFAAIRGLTDLEDPHNVEIRSTSEMLVNAVNSRALEDEPDLAQQLLPLLDIHNPIAILQKRRNDPEHQETYGLALRAAQSRLSKPDTGYEARELKAQQERQATAAETEEPEG